MGKKLLLGMLTAGALTAYSQPISVYIEPFFTYINYSNSKIKKDGYSTTLYGFLSLQNGLHVFEGAYAYTHLNYKNNLSNWNENDYTISYTNYQLFPLYFKVGYHYIASPNTDVSKDGNIYFADIGNIKRYAYNYGLFASYSSYRYKVSVKEFRPHVGFYRWLDYYRGFYYSLDATWINISNPQNIGTTKKNYLSIQGGITYFTPKYSIGGSLWLGQRVLMVDNGGFVVYNLKERYKYGINLKGRYYLNRKISVQLQLGLSQYKELETGKDVGVFTSTLSVGYSF